jgi:hypothetical protein
MEGDTQKDMVLTEARAMIVRAYLAENFGFDNSLLKTLGMGKRADTNVDADWGSIQILIFAVGTGIPAASSLRGEQSSSAISVWHWKNDDEAE